MSILGVLSPPASAPQNGWMSAVELGAHYYQNGLQPFHGACSILALLRWALRYDPTASPAAGANAKREADARQPTHAVSSSKSSRAQAPARAAGALAWARETSAWTLALALALAV